MSSEESKKKRIRTDKEPFTKNSTCGWCEKLIVDSFYVRTIGDNVIYCESHCHKFGTEEYELIPGADPDALDAYEFVVPDSEFVVPDSEFVKISNNDDRKL